MDGYLQVALTPTHLAIVMEYAAGGELFDRIVSAGRFSEDEVVQFLVTFSHSMTIPNHCFSGYIDLLSVAYLFACYVWCEMHHQQARFFFQQLISGVSYCHSMVYYTYV